MLSDALLRLLLVSPVAAKHYPNCYKLCHYLVQAAKVDAKLSRLESCYRLLRQLRLVEIAAQYCFEQLQAGV